MSNEVSYLKVNNSDESTRYTINDETALKKFKVNFIKEGQTIISVEPKSGLYEQNVFDIDIDELINDKLFHYANYYEIEIDVEDYPEIDTEVYLKKAEEKINTELQDQLKPSIIFCYHMENNGKIFDTIWTRKIIEDSPEVTRIFNNILYPEVFPEVDEDINNFFNSIFNYQSIEQIVNDFGKIPYYTEYTVNKQEGTVRPQVSKYKKRYYYTSENYLELNIKNGEPEIIYKSGTDIILITKNNVTNVKKMLI